MTAYNIWMMIGWSIPIAIVIVCAVLAYRLYMDAKYQASRLVSAPELNTETNTEHVLGKDTGFASRAERRKKKKSGAPVLASTGSQSTSESSLWSDNNDSFDLTSGTD